LVTIEKVRRKEVGENDNLLDVNGLSTFIRNTNNKFLCLDPYLQLRNVLDVLVSSPRTTISSLDTLIVLIKEVYGVKQYKHKLYKLIFFLNLLEKYCNKNVVLLLYNKKAIKKLGDSIQFKSPDPEG